MGHQDCHLTKREWSGPRQHREEQQARCVYRLRQWRLSGKDTTTLAGRERFGASCPQARAHPASTRMCLLINAQRMCLLFKAMAEATERAVRSF